MTDYTKLFKDKIKYDQFNNFRVDLDIKLVYNGETVLVHHNDKYMIVNLHDMSILAASIGPEMMRQVEFLHDSIADTPDNYLNGDWAIVISYRKEAKNMQGDDVRQRLWCEQYNIHNSLEEIQRSNPILNVLNEPLDCRKRTDSESPIPQGATPTAELNPTEAKKAQLPNT